MKREIFIGTRYHSEHVKLITLSVPDLNETVVLAAAHPNDVKLVKEAIERGRAMFSTHLPRILRTPT